jgi:hypothetical protein
VTCCAAADVGDWASDAASELTADSGRAHAVSDKAVASRKRQLREVFIMLP